MIKLLTYLVVILAILTVVQIVRIFELASELRGVREEEVKNSDTKLNAKLMMVFVIAFLAFCFWQLIEYKDLLLPVAASEHGVKLDVLFNFNMAIIAFVFILVNIVLFYFAYKYAYTDGKKASFFAHSNKLELIWTTIPAMVLSVIIIYGLATWNSIMKPITDPNVMVMELYSKQFDWTARYSGKDNKLGGTNYKLIASNNALGINPEDPASADDKVIKGEFHLVKGKPVVFKFRSRDVIHSAFMPHFRAQMNTVPGMETTFNFTPTKTTEEMREITHNPRFDFVLLCNKICGSAHWNMQMKIVVESQAEYDAWLAKQKTFSEELAASAEGAPAGEVAGSRETGAEKVPASDTLKAEPSHDAKKN
jgi:cytochrome c oxidase subunit II